MADGPERSDREWLVEPIGPGDVRIHVNTGDGVELSPEIRNALDALMEALLVDEVGGFSATCPDLDACGNYTCTLGKCQPQGKSQCLWNESCKIASFRIL